MDVTIITPAYNAEKYLKFCIESVATISGFSFEHIVVDDGSTDCTADIMRDYPNIISIYQENKGANFARNIALDIAQGRFVKFLDSDDLLVENALASQLDMALSLPASDITYGYCEAFYENNVFKILKRIDKGYAHPIVDVMLRNIAISLPLYPLHALRKIGFFDVRMHARQEWNLNIKLVSNGYNFIYDNIMIFKQRFHSSVNRISNRNLVVEKEIHNVNYAFEAIKNSKDQIVYDAWASYLWCIGRQFIYQGDNDGALVFFNHAKEISEGYSKFLSLKYRILKSIVGPVNADYYFNRMCKILNKL